MSKARSLSPLEASGGSISNVNILSMSASTVNTNPTSRHVHGDQQVKSKLSSSTTVGPPSSTTASSSIVAASTNMNMNMNSSNTPGRSRKYSFGSSSYGHSLNNNSYSNNSNSNSISNSISNSNANTTTGSTSHHHGNPKSSSNADSSSFGNYPTKVEFSPFDRNVFGVINYHHRGNREEDPHSHPVQSSSNWRGKKLSSRLGPILLELASFQPGNWNSDNNNDCRMKSMDIIATSRGNPALGVNIASTCLSFRKSNHHHFDQQQQQQQHNNSLFHCATGTSSGALCIHSFRDGSSTVQYYVPPRHHRMATDVVWRDGNHYASQYVAIGLVGATSSSSHHHNPNASSSTNSSAGISGAASSQYYLHHHHHSSSSSERDFCCLVWDVETQGLGGSITGTAADNNNATTSITNTKTTTASNTNKTTTNNPNMAVVGGVHVSVKTPVYRVAHNAPVASLAWICGGQYLVIGCQSRGNLQIYDLRVSAGMNGRPPINTHAHEHTVQGIHPDPFRPNMFSTYSRNIVKLWDVRRMDSSVSEIKIPSSLVSSMAWSPSTAHTLCVATSVLHNNNTNNNTNSNNGNYSSLRYYDTETRPVLTNLVELKQPIQGLTFQPPPPPVPSSSSTNISSKTTNHMDDNTNNHRLNKPSSPEEKKDETAILYPHRLLAVQCDGTIQDMPQHQIAPLAISPRDGRVSHSLGNMLWMGTTTYGPSGMEHTEYTVDEDISTTMMRRARCLHQARYSTNINQNLKMLREERQLDSKNEEAILLHQQQQQEQQQQRQQQQNNIISDTASIDREDGNNDDNGMTTSNESQVLHDSIEMVGEMSLSIAARRTLFRLWEWIERIETLCSSEGNPSSVIDDLPAWPVKGLNDAGIVKLLRIELHESDDLHLYDKVFPSETLFCNTYDSPMRRAALTACGWKGRFSLRDILAECEDMGHFERSAALAVWDGDLSEAVAALQRGADHIRELVQEQKVDNNRPARLSTLQYAETLQLVAMCMAGYTPNGSTISGVWRRACEGLLQRQDLSHKGRVTTHIHYLRAACNFLVGIGMNDGFDRILNDDILSLSDRVAFACRFLPRRDLIVFLNYYMKKSMDTGNLEGLVITGLGKRGIHILQSYVDTYSDVQTAALVSSRISLPRDWIEERVICSEWLDSYREILNTWQMWQSRATFDVGRADLLRNLRKKHAEEMAANAVPQGGRQHHQGRRSGYAHVVPPPNIKKPSYHHPSSSSSSMKQLDVETPIPIFPPQLYARCNYCNTTLPLSKLRRQEGIANSWLSRQKPVLSCCPKCKKPLPRCAICLLTMGCLNPYMELMRESHNSSRNLQGVDDLSGLANLPFAEWFTWCMRCKHGGHAHHMVGWFANHETCPVSGCDCKCQFDGIQKLARPALTKGKTAQNP